jgi:AcrR family transcriptional regulator
MTPTAPKASPRAAPRRLDLKGEKQAALLDAAAVEFNAYGVAGASLSRIARAVGLTRAALYYYFESREDLAFHCYVRTCRQAAEDLAGAAAAKNGLDRVRAFILHTLDPARPAAVVLSEIACLAAPQRAEIEAAHGANIAALTRFIDGGIRDGSVRSCDAEIVAQTLIGMLAWLPLAGEWTVGRGDDVKAHAARTLADVVSDGIAVDPAYPFECPLDIDAFAFKPGNAFDREAAAAMKVELLARAASKLFNQRGIDGTSLDQVTQVLGATKGAFYQHIPDKASLVAECHRRQMDLSRRIADAAGKAGKNGLERSLIGMHLLVQAFASELSPLSPLTGLEALPAKARAAIQRGGQELSQRYEDYNRQGIRDGSFRPFDTRTMAVAGAGVFSWIPRWHADDDPRTPRFIADEVTRLFIQGLRKRK